MPFREIRILYVEDNPGDVTLVRKSLDIIGAPYFMEVVTDGEQAKTYFEELPAESQYWPYLILLDLMLPKVPGEEVLRYLKTHPSFRYIPVVIFSSGSVPERIIDAYDRNVNCFVEKPRTADGYRNVVQSLWDFWSMTASLPNTAALF